MEVAQVLIVGMHVGSAKAGHKHPMTLLAAKSCGRFAWAVYLRLHVARLVEIVAGVVAGWCVCTWV